MKITVDWLKEKRACGEGRRWFEAQSETDVAKITEKLIDEDRLDWANWLLSRAFTKRQRVQYAIFAAEQVLHLFEERYPEDKRPRNAIEAAKKWLEDESDAAADAAAAYAAYAAYAAAYAAADAAADAAAAAAADAAYAAYAAADAAAYAYAAAADAAAYAADAAADAAAAAAAAADAAAYAAYAYAAAADAYAADAYAADAYAAKREMKVKILRFGIGLIQEKVAA